MSVRGEVIVKVLAYAAFGGMLYLVWRKANEQGAFDPTSDKNLAYRTANSLWQGITGNPIDTVGTAFGDWVAKARGEPDPAAPVDLVLVEDAAGNAYYMERKKAQAAGMLSPPWQRQDAYSSPVTGEDFRAWMAATGGVLRPGETQEQAIRNWRAGLH